MAVPVTTKEMLVCKCHINATVYFFPACRERSGQLAVAA